MVEVNSLSVGVVMCVITMICWGSHANALKLLTKSYSFSYYYWDFVIGYLVVPILIGLTFGTFGNSGRGFFEDLIQGSNTSFMYAILGGFVFNLSNILFISAVNIAGMAVAFPIGVGIALVEGVIVNYFNKPEGNPILIFGGVVLITIAIIVNSLAYKKMQSVKEEKNVQTETTKAIILAISGGILMGLFYFLLQRSMSGDLSLLEPGKFGPYAAVVVFAFGIFISNFIFNGYLMANPIKGVPVKYAGYFIRGNIKNHMVSFLGGCVASLGTSLSIIASGVVSAAVAYGLGQGAPMVATIWGFFVWKEFKDAPKGTIKLIILMFTLFLLGLSFLIISKL